MSAVAAFASARAPALKGVTRGSNKPAIIPAERVSTRRLTASTRQPHVVAEETGVVTRATVHGGGGGSDRWRESAFAAYCDDVLERPEVSEGLRVLEQRHPELDPNIVLLGMWLATRGDGGHAMTHAELRTATKISERWRWRVGDNLRHAEASLRGADLAETPPAAELAAAVSALAGEVTRVSRAALFENATSHDWWRGGVGHDHVDDDVDDGRGGGGVLVRGATWRACTNLRLYHEYLGLRLIKGDWERVRDVFGGCMEASGIDVSGDVCGAQGGVDDGEEEEGATVGEERRDTETETGEGMRDAVWRAVRGAIDETTVKPHKAQQKQCNERYLRARRNLAEADKQWKASCQDYKDARRRIKHARHEVHKSRKAVRVEFR